MDYVGLLNMELNQTNVGLYLKIKENILQIT